MSLKQFEIVFDSPVYYAGQNITGRLLVEISKPKKLKGIRLHYFGIGIVHWEDGSLFSGPMSARKYLDLQQLLFGDYTEESELAAGKHVFIFSCPLPTNLPCSYKGLYGRIGYSITATADRPWKLNYVTKKSVTILSVFDLNLHPEIVAPISKKGTKTFWGHSGLLFMSIDLPVRGFVSGQIIPIKIFLKNESEVQVKSIIFTLKQKVVFHTKKKSNWNKVCLSKNVAPIEQGCRRKEALFKIQVPAVPPSYLEFCNIIDISYRLNVEAVVGGLHTNLKITTEIVIGNIPVMEYQRPLPGVQLSNDPSRSQLQDHPPSPSSIGFPQLAAYGNLSSPTYELGAGVFGWRTPKNPLYPVYKFGTIHKQDDPRGNR